MTTAALKPVVFLDIDGVLHIKNCALGELSSYCVENLNWLTDTTRAEIVISSTWRYIRGVRDILVRQGITGRIIGETPKFLPGYVTRGREIAAWLTGDNSARSFVILDDESDLDGFLPFHVLTLWQSGLTRPLAERAAEILRKGGKTRGRVKIK